MSPRRHFGCLYCYKSFPKFRIFIQHWNNVHEGKININIISTDGGKRDGDVDVDMIDVGSSVTDSPPKTPDPEEPEELRSGPGGDRNAAAAKIFVTTPPPSIASTSTSSLSLKNDDGNDDSDSDSDDDEEDEKFAYFFEKCLIIGDKRCKVTLGSALGERHLIVLKSKIHGRGLFTGNVIRQGEMIIEYAGKVVEEEEALKLQKKYDAQRIHNYIMKLGNKMYVDGTVLGNCSRFTNHSCNPNCGTNIVSFLGLKRAFIYALRDIKCGEELTYDYQFTADELVRCTCGTKGCRGVLNYNIGKLRLKNPVELEMILSQYNY